MHQLISSASSWYTIKENKKGWWGYEIATELWVTTHLGGNTQKFVFF